MAKCRAPKSRVKVVVPTRMMKLLLDIPVWPGEVMLYSLTRKYKINNMNLSTDCPLGEYNGFITWPTERDKAEYFKRKGFDYEAYKRNGCQLSAILD